MRESRGTLYHCHDLGALEVVRHAAHRVHRANGGADTDVVTLDTIELPRPDGAPGTVVCVFLLEEVAGVVMAEVQKVLQEVR